MSARALRPALVVLCLVGSSLLWAAQEGAKPEFPRVVKPGAASSAAPNTMVGSEKRCSASATPSCT